MYLVVLSYPLFILYIENRENVIITGEEGYIRGST